MFRCLDLGLEVGKDKCKIQIIFLARMKKKEKCCLVTISILSHSPQSITSTIQILDSSKILLTISPKFYLCVVSSTISLQILPPFTIINNLPFTYKNSNFPMRSQTFHSHFQQNPNIQTQPLNYYNQEWNQFSKIIISIYHTYIYSSKM